MLTTYKIKTRKLEEGLQVISDNGKFNILFDESKPMGGTDKGMGPVEGLLSAIGACQAIVATMFKKAKKISFSDFSIEVEGDIDMDGVMHKKDIRTGLQEIRYKMHFVSDEPEEKIKEYAKFIEMTCPVSDTVRNGTKMINTGVVISNK